MAISPIDLGLLNDGSDQTTAALLKLSGLGANWEGEIRVPLGVKLDLQAVIEALPDKAILRFATAFQDGSGYRQQLIGVGDQPPNANSDTAFAIVSGHYADLHINNMRSAGTLSAQTGLSGLSWGRGFFRKGTRGPRVQWQMNFSRGSERQSEYGGKGVGAFMLVTRAPERAGNYEEWGQDMTVAASDYVVAPNDCFYRAVTAGTSTEPPTHVSGEQTIGGITWAFESSWVPFKTAFSVDELGRIGTGQVPTGTTHYWQQNPEDTEDFVIRYQANGPNKKVRLLFEPTNAAKSNVAVPKIEASESVGVRMLSSDETRILWTATNVRGFGLGTHGMVAKDVVDGKITPSVKEGGRLVIANSASTTITDFIDALPDQQVELYFTNGNTTLASTATLVPRGGTAVAVPADGIVVIVRNPSNTKWVEKSRNF